MKLLGRIFGECDAGWQRRACWYAGAAYAALAAVIIWFHRFELNPDAVGYVQVARYYANGSLDLAVNSWWSPLLSWLIAPLTFLRIEPLVIARMVLAVAGLGFAAGTAALIRNLTGKGSFIGFVLGLGAALVMLAGLITPDLLLAALVTWYFVLMLKVLRGGSLKLAFGAGLVGGLGFLAKSYALPFVTAHLLLSLGLKAWLFKREPPSACVKQWLASVAGFLLLAVPWVGVMSQHEGHLTVSSAGARDAGFSRDEDSEAAGRLPIFALKTPREGRISSWENPMEIRGDWPTMPPLTTLEGLRHKIRNVSINLAVTAEALDGIDHLGLVKAGLVLALLSLFPLRERLHTERGALVLWLCLSSALFVGGYEWLLIDGRYLWPVWSLLLTLCVIAFPSLGSEDGSSAEPGGPVRPCEGGAAETAALHPRAAASRLAMCHRAFLLALVLLVSWNVGWGVVHYALVHGGARDAAALRAAARQLKGHPALAANNWYAGLFAAYWSNNRFLGKAPGRTAEEVAEQLAPFGRVILLVANDSDLTEKLTASARFTRLDLHSTALAAFETAGQPR